MHELSVAANIIEIARQYLPENIIDCNIILKIQAGAFRNIMPELLLFSYKVLTEKTELEGSVLEIENIPLTVLCNGCGRISEIEPAFFFCPFCSSNEVEINTGNELQVKEIEIIENIKEMS
ncbi:MAG: hydrogenase maturation nickel metallochaperone HypA [bacterium]